MHTSNFASESASLRAPLRPHPLSLPDDALIREADVRLCVPFGRTTLHHKIAAGTFPRPHRLAGSSIRVWRVRQIREWIAQVCPEQAAA